MNERMVKKEEGRREHGVRGGKVERGGRRNEERDRNFNKIDKTDKIDKQEEEEVNRGRACKAVVDVVTNQDSDSNSRPHISD